MWLQRSSKTLNRLVHRFTPLSTAGAAAVAPAGEDPLAHLSPPYHYLEGFPRPDAKHNETILAVPRSKSGKNISAKERKVGRVPSIVFEQENGQEGGNKLLISLQTKQIKKLVDHLGRSFFLSRLFELEVRSEFREDGEVFEKVLALPRKLHLHAGTDAVLNVTFLRAPSSALLRVDVPLVFRGDDVCPGLRKGAYLNTIKRTVKYLCPADIIPPYIDIDLSELDVGQKLLMKDLKVHPALKLLHSPGQPVCNIIGSKGCGAEKVQVKPLIVKVQRSRWALIASEEFQLNYWDSTTTFCLKYSGYECYSDFLLLLRDQIAISDIPSATQFFRLEIVAEGLV